MFVVYVMGKWLAAGVVLAWIGACAGTGDVSRLREAAPEETPALVVSPVSGADARAAFARFQSLAGTWDGRSTKGWEGRITIEVIARGTVVKSTSQFEAHPGETMVTMYHMHGDELVLTHYCVAGNQPRLHVTSYEDGGRQMTFAYRDGTGLASRDEGHMDEVVYRFEDADSFSSQWSWYQEGTQSWMEAIQYERVR